MPRKKFISPITHTQLGWVIHKWSSWLSRKWVNRHTQTWWRLRHMRNVPTMGTLLYFFSLWIASGNIKSAYKILLKTFFESVKKP